MHDTSSTCCAMWSKMDSQLAVTGITMICESKWRAPLSGCWEGLSDFVLLSIGNFSRYANIPIMMMVVTLEGLPWYIFPAECLIGVFRVKLKMSARRW